MYLCVYLLLRSCRAHLENARFQVSLRFKYPFVFIISTSYLLEYSTYLPTYLPPPPAAVNDACT